MLTKNRPIPKGVNGFLLLDMEGMRPVENMDCKKSCWL